MKHIKNRITRLMLFFYLISSYMGATHIHHKDFTVHSDCKVCIVVKNLHGNDIVDDNFLLDEVRNNFEFQTLVNDILYATVIKGFNSQAPPLFS